VIHDVATRLAEVLAAQPAPVLPAASIAARRPAATAELPAVALTITADRGDELGFGRVVRGSEQLPGGDQMREDLHGDWFAGTVTFEIYATAADAAAALTRAVDRKLGGSRAALRERGFSVLRPVELAPMESAREEPGGAAAFNAWKQRLAYRFAFERIDGGELTDSGLIDRVDVDLVEQPTEESFSTP
jgi:hypothetical protein